MSCCQGDDDGTGCTCGQNIRRAYMKCPNCKENTLHNSLLGEYCSNNNCGYVDGTVFQRPKKQEKTQPLTKLQRAHQTIRALEQTISDLRSKLWDERNRSCGYCGRAPSHPADGC